MTIENELKEKFKQGKLQSYLDMIRFFDKEREQSKKKYLWYLRPTDKAIMKYRRHCIESLDEINDEE